MLRLDRAEERSEGFASCLPALIAVALMVGISHVLFAPVGFFLVVAFIYIGVFSCLCLYWLNNFANNLTRMLCEVEWKDVFQQLSKRRTLAWAGLVLAFSFFIAGLMW